MTELRKIPFSTEQIEAKVYDPNDIPRELKVEYRSVTFGVRWCDLCREMHDKYCKWELFENEVKALSR